MKDRTNAMLVRDLAQKAVEDAFAAIDRVADLAPNPKISLAVSLVAFAALSEDYSRRIAISRLTYGPSIEPLLASVDNLRAVLANRRGNKNG